MQVHNNSQLYKSPVGDQLWNSGRQYWIFSRIGDQEGAISDPDKTLSGRLRDLKNKGKVQLGNTKSSCGRLRQLLSHYKV